MLIRSRIKGIDGGRGEDLHSVIEMKNKKTNKILKCSHLLREGGLRIKWH